MFKLSEDEVMSMLNENLKEHVTSFLNGKILVNWISLKVFDMIIISEITLNLSREIFGMDDNIFEEKWPADKLYFIAKGKIILLHLETHTYLKELKEGDSFGEAGFFSRLTRWATAKSNSFSEILVLNSQQLDRVLDEHSNEKETYNLIQDNIRK